MDHYVLGMIMAITGVLLIVNRVQVNIRVSDIAGLAVMLFLVYILHSCANILQSSCTRSLSDLTLIYCGKADFGHFLSAFLLNRTTIRRKIAQKLTQNGLSLATIGQARQAPGRPDISR
jgi:hypothetical protein